MFLQTSLVKFKIVRLIEFLKFFSTKSSVQGISETAGWIFTNLQRRYMSKLLDVKCKFMYKSDCHIGSYGRFLILAPACSWWGDVIDPEFFVSSLYISVGIKVRFLKFRIFNRYENNTSKLVFVFCLTSKLLIKIAFLTFLKNELDFHEI